MLAFEHLRARPHRAVATVALAALVLVTHPGRGSAQRSQTAIPRTWDDQAVEEFHLPLAQPGRSPRFMSAEEYYQLRVRPVYRTYPVYARGREPAGYLESLKQTDPEVVFDPATLQTDEDWIRAGELVFDAPTDLTVPPPEVRSQAERQPAT